MPLWTIHHSPDSLTAQDRHDLAAGITDLYAILPRFYVGIVFQEAAPDSLFIGGEVHDRFARIAVDQIARTLPDETARERWIARVGTLLTPFFAARDIDWELHIGETSRDLWLIQGLRPPLPGTDAEQLWRDRNAPVPYDRG